MLDRRDLLKQLPLALATPTLLSTVAVAAVPEARGAVKIFAGRSGRLGDPDRRFVLVGGVVVPLAQEPALQRELAAIAADLGRKRLKFATNPRNKAHFERALTALLRHAGVKYVGAWLDNVAPAREPAVHAAWRQATEKYFYAGQGAARRILIEALRHDFAVDDAVCRTLAGDLGCEVTLRESANLGSPLMDLSGAITKGLNAAGRAVASNPIKNGMAAAARAAFGLDTGAPGDITTDRLSLRRVRL